MSFRPINGAVVDFNAEYPKGKLTSEDYLLYVAYLYESIKDLIEEKNISYSGEYPFTNAEKAEEYGIDPMVGVLLRMEDKMQRVRNFVRTGRLGSGDESLEDAFKDIIGYATMCLGMLYQDKAEADDEG